MTVSSNDAPLNIVCYRRKLAGNPFRDLNLFCHNVSFLQKTPHIGSDS